MSEVPVPRELPLGRKTGVQIHVWENPDGRGCSADHLWFQPSCGLCMKPGLPGGAGSAVLERGRGGCALFLRNSGPTQTVLANLHIFPGVHRKTGNKSQGVHKPPSSAAQFSHIVEEMGNSRSFRVIQL